MRQIRPLGAVLLAAALVAGPACAGGSSPTETPAASPEATLTVAEFLEEDGRFDIFVRLVKEGTIGLFDIMGGPEFRNNTLFVPTDEAFEALGEERIEQIIAEERERARIRIHIVPFPLPSGKFESKVYETAHGSGQLAMEVAGEVVTVNGARVIETDLSVTNGTLHAIDQVLGVED